jgi:hypothetical protein
MQGNGEDFRALDKILGSHLKEFFLGSQKFVNNYNKFFYKI